MSQNQKTTGSEICSIRIMFPVTSDEQAIEYKKKIQSVLSDNPEAQIQFSIASVPARASMSPAG